MESDREAAAQLAALGSRGARAGFEAVFAQHGDEAFRLCCALVGEEGGERLLRRVAERAAGELQTSAAPSEPRRWLLKLANDTALEEEGHRRRRQPIWKQSPPTAARDRPPSAEEPDPERIRSLGRRQRAGLVLTGLSSLSYAAAGEILGIDEATARECVKEARRALQPHLPREGPMCEVARGLIADDERGEAESEALAEHLATCEQCPKVQASAAGLASALRKAFPKMAPTLLLAVLREAAAHAAEPTDATPSERGQRLRRHLSRQAALVAIGALLVAALALGVGARSVDNPTAVLEAAPVTIPKATLGIPGVGPGDVPCARGLIRVRDHCELALKCPQGTEFRDGECVLDPVCLDRPQAPDARCPPWACPPDTDWKQGRCVRRVVLELVTVGCRIGRFTNGRCVVPDVCSDGRRPVEGQCIVGVVCPPDTDHVSDGQCVRPGVCEEPAERVGSECRLPVRCPKGSVPAGDFCELDAECPARTTPVRGTCLLDAECPPGTNPVTGHCFLQPECPDGTTPVSGRCPPIGPTPVVPIPVTGPADRHGDSPGRGHRGAEGGRGHDPAHNARLEVPETQGETEGEPQSPAAQGETTPEATPLTEPTAPSQPAPAPPAPPVEAPEPDPALDSRPGRGLGRGRGNGRGHDRQAGVAGESGPGHLPGVVLLAAAGVALARSSTRRRRR